MRLDGDFAAYLAARWPVLVRLLVLLGGRPDEAEDAVRAGLARDYADWARISRSDDPDVHVYRSVLEAWDRRPGGWWNAPPPGPDAEPDPGARGPGAPARPAHRARAPRARAPVRRRPERATGGPGARRAPGRGAGPRGTRPRAGRPRGGPGDEPVNELRLNQPSVEEIFRDAVASVDTLPPPLEASGSAPRTSSDAAVAAGRGGRGGRRRPRPPRHGHLDRDPFGRRLRARAPPVVTMVENPADVAWWADGELHLANVTSRCHRPAARPTTWSRSTAARSTATRPARSSSRVTTAR